MRIVSQDGCFNIPYKTSVIYMAEDKLNKTWNIYADINISCNCICLGKFSDEEKAKIMFNDILVSGSKDTKAIKICLDSDLVIKGA